MYIYTVRHKPEMYEHKENQPLVKLHVTLNLKFKILDQWTNGPDISADQPFAFQNTHSKIQSCLAPLLLLIVGTNLSTLALTSRTHPGTPHDECVKW